MATAAEIAALVLEHKTMNANMLSAEQADKAERRNNIPSSTLAPRHSMRAIKRVSVEEPPV